MENVNFVLENAILYQDNDLIIINKPSGMLSIPGGFSKGETSLSEILETKFGKIWTVHRIDKLTSGAILFAKSADSHKLLNTQFQNRAVKKVYRALVYGTPVWDEKEIELPLKVNGDRRHRTIVDPQNGKQASTTVRVERRFEGFSLVSASPHSGYTHQIRAHLSNLGYPILADPLYKLPPNPLEDISAAAYQKQRLRCEKLHLISRLALHAFQIRFAHPFSGELTTIHAPYPEDFQAALTKLAHHII